MKKILRVTIESKEVEDDHAPELRNNASEDHMVIEFEGSTYIGGQREGTFMFIAVDENFFAISPLMQFIWWMTMGWQGFYTQLPTKLRDWMSWFNGTMKKIPLSYAEDLVARTARRRAEIDSQTINFKNWDPEVFDVPSNYFSAN